MTSTSKQQPIGVLKEGARVVDVASLQALITAAKSSFLPGWEETQNEIRRQYEGHILESVSATMQRRYPATAHRMPLAPFNLAAAIAEKSASVYEQGCRREILNVDGETEEGTPAADDFAGMITGAKLDVTMPEAERRAVLAKTIFLHVRSDSVEAMATGRPPRTVVDIFWPQDVLVVPHPMAPTVLQASLALLVRVAGPGGSGPGITTYVHWRRDVVVGDGGIVGLGSWRADLITHERRSRATFAGLGPAMIDETVSVRPLWDPYPLKLLPFVAMHRGIPSGSPYLDSNRNLPHVLNNLNATFMSTIHIVDQSTAPIWVHKTNEPQPKNVVLAPGAKANIRLGEELTSEQQNAQLLEVRNTNKDLLETLALTMRVSSDTFVAEASGIPSSGTALRIKNIPQEKARHEDIARYMPMEEEELLPVMVEVHDHFRGTSIGGIDRKYRCVPNDLPNYESAAEKQTRIIEAEAQDWISTARAAVEAGYYETEKEAEASIAKLKEERASRMSTALPPMPPPDGAGDGSDVGSPPSAKEDAPSDPSTQEDGTKKPPVEEQPR
jgi:hypothetical protein